MKISHILSRGISVIAMVATASAQADDSDFRVRVECNRQEHTLMVHFIGVTGNVDAVQRHPWRPRDIDPAKLIVYGEEDEKGDIRTWDERKLTRVCRLGRNRYDIQIRPHVARGWQPTGRCAVAVGAMVTVTLKGKQVGSIENDHCNLSSKEEIVDRSMVITVGQAVRYLDVRSDQFDLELISPR